MKNYQFKYATSLEIVTAYFHGYTVEDALRKFRLKHGHDITIYEIIWAGYVVIAD